MLLPAHLRRVVHREKLPLDNRLQHLATTIRGLLRLHPPMPPYRQHLAGRSFLLHHQALPERRTVQAVAEAPISHCYSRCCYCRRCCRRHSRSQ